MTASISNFSAARERREIQRLEKAVKQHAANVRAGACADYTRSDYFTARSPEEQRFRDIPLWKTAEPQEPWLSSILAGLCWALVVALCVVALPLVWGAL